MVGPVDGAGMGWAIGAGVLLSFVSAGGRGRAGRRRILEGLDAVNLPGHSECFECSESTTCK